MKPETFLDKICHFIFHRRYFVENFNGEGRTFYPRWQNVYFGIPSDFVWYFHEHGQGHFMGQVNFDTERAARVFLLRPDVDRLRFDVKPETILMRVK